MSEESVVSSRLRDITESTEAEARDDTHHTRSDGQLKARLTVAGDGIGKLHIP
jgi:hypothetical protein